MSPAFTNNSSTSHHLVKPTTIVAQTFSTRLGQIMSSTRTVHEYSERQRYASLCDIATYSGYQLTFAHVRYEWIIHRLTPLPRHHQNDFKITRRKANATRYIYISIRHRANPPWRHHVTEHKITRKKRRKLVELRRPEEQPSENSPTRSMKHEPKEEFDASLGYP